MKIKIYLTKDEIYVIKNIDKRGISSFELSKKEKYFNEKELTILEKVERALIELGNVFEEINEENIFNNIAVEYENCDDNFAYENKNIIYNFILDYKYIICNYNGRIRKIYFEEVRK